MKTKNIIKALAFTLLLTTACSREVFEYEYIEGEGYAIPVTLKVTRQGATKATFDDGTKKLSFSTGDKLFVEGSHAEADRFAGTLDYVPATGKFSGTIYTESLYEGTIDDLLNGNYATLLPAGYESTGYLTISDDGYQAHLEESPWKSFATSKAAGVEQLSFEHGEYTIGTGFALEPQKAILNFTITGLTPSTKVTATLSDDEVWTPDIEGEVTTDGSGNATFAIGLEDSSDLNDFSLTVAGSPITLVSSSKVLVAGKIYNITRTAPWDGNLATLTADTIVPDGTTLYGTLDTENHPVKITIANNATVTLDGITINGVNNSSYRWAGLNCEGNATIILKDGTINTVNGFYESYPGIHVPKDYTLTIQGTGTLNASSNVGAGIGGGYKINCGNIQIESGTINVDSHYGTAAGIGGGRDASCGNITISGGLVTAIGGAAGIGTGSRYSETTSCGNISITGGTVIASTSAYNAAGIGTAGNGHCGSITITSGVTSVTATKGPESVNSIGKGWTGGSCGTVTIEGVQYWNGSSYQNNGGDYLTRSTLVYPVVTDLSTITEDYTASFRETLTGTLGANVKISIADGHTVTLDGVSINASGTWTTGDYAGITCLGDATIILKDGSANTVKGFHVQYPGISVPAGKTLIIKGETAPGTGSLNASSNAASSDVISGAGIGGHSSTSCGNIEIQGGMITATCTGKYGAGIGGGGASGAADCGTITISGGTVTATGGRFAAGIGSGTDGDCGAITITSGVTSVTANRGSGSSYDCVGRGNGSGSTCASVTIGGTVYWDGSAYQNDGEAKIRKLTFTYTP